MKTNQNIRAAFVLIELLMAAAMAGLLLAAVFAVYYAAVNTVSVQNTWRARHEPAAEAVAAMARDLACAAVPYGLTNPPFAASGGGREEFFRMSFYSAFPEASSNDPGFYSLGRVSYNLRKDPLNGRMVLARECSPMRAPARSQGATVRQEWRGIGRLEVLFFDGSAWVGNWGEDGGTNSLPAAARISIAGAREDRKEAGTEVIL
ncbi:MAG: hypothetical protein WC299_14570, partial [Kiritimatiellia bacterium]